ncbi:MAG: 3-methyl-2-oxobutanoate hydroxymethyltransferase [Firmicutes bacterium]|nr:3-methyl-2-oxobutanoate hydroxymethyltransferase [Bacillota bacterium]
MVQHNENKKKMTVPDFKKFKQEGKKFAYVTAYDYSMAQCVNASDVEIILVGDSLGMTMLGYDGTVPVTMDDMVHHIKSVVKGAPETFIVGDMPFGSYQEGPQQAIHNAIRLLKETGCDCVKLEGGVEMADTIQAMTKMGIPVMGHIGLTPQTATTVGGFKMQGGTPETAKKLLEDARKLQEVGCFSMVLECVPKGVAKKISEELEIPVLGIGAGPWVDCQVIVLHDILDLAVSFKPKFVKRFAHIGPAIIEALNQFHAETLAGTFPDEATSFNKEVEIPKLY